MDLASGFISSCLRHTFPHSDESSHGNFNNSLSAARWEDQLRAAKANHTFSRSLCEDVSKLTLLYSCSSNPYTDNAWAEPLVGIPTRASRVARHPRFEGRPTATSYLHQSSISFVALLHIPLSAVQNCGAAKPVTTCLAFRGFWFSNAGLIVSIFIPGTFSLSFAQTLPKERSST
jgi:hypothetical protein